MAVYHPRNSKRFELLLGYGTESTCIVATPDNVMG